jgi:hypothetical protein
LFHSLANETVVVIAQCAVADDILVQEADLVPDPEADPIHLVCDDAVT